MYLLADTTEVDFPTWIQAITAIAALIISILTFRQQKKIRELADIVVELKKQSDILKNRYELETRVNLKNLVPFFVYASYRKAEDRVFVVDIKNEGMPAFNVRFEYLIDPADNLEIISVWPKKDFQTNDIVGYRVRYKQDIELERTNFVFSLISEDNTGTSYKQRITCNNGRIIIDFPTLNE